MGHVISMLCAPTPGRTAEAWTTPEDNDSTIVSGRTSGSRLAAGVVVAGATAGAAAGVAAPKPDPPRLSGSLRVKERRPQGSVRFREASAVPKQETAGERVDGKYLWVEGRRFLRDTKGGANFLVPMDETEGERWAKRHELLRYCLARNFFAPVGDILEKGARVLEIGCGIGSWTLDMSPTFSNSRFLGLDSSELFPKWNSTPPNCRFQTHDIAVQPLAFPDAEFDFIFRGASAPVRTAAQWAAVLAEAYRVLKPGGYVELVEIDVKVKGVGEFAARWFGLQSYIKFNHLPSYPDKSIATSRSIDPRVFRRLPTLLSDAGLTVTLQETFNVPVGQWGGYIGESWAMDLEASARGLRVAFAREGGVAGPEFDALLEGLVDEYKMMRGGLNIYVVVARKGGGEEKGKGGD
ncbi:S-adenosyl-L-methionine-dependent methyltransferase [Endogone sp. FLAS-F59071]|nr:S-adenosyl-L-methionine-dependent methyltransferase [Endogone sp. FLAS-F59071]|eukprot:RUS13615.1 S-adenosyl-L-methionine-dependent methyltransferase [Endogone sp. FLAS-F59071]